MNKKAAENAFKEGFEAGMRFQAAAEAGLRNTDGLDIESAWQEFVDSCSDL